MEAVHLFKESENRFNTFHQLLERANKKVNLVGKPSKEELKGHCLDSLLLAKYLSSDTEICDIGSGGGYPVIPLAIVHSEKNFTAIDASKRKCDFIIYAAQQLSLNNVSTWHGRVEEASHLNESFEVITARALAPLKELIPLALPLVKRADKSQLLFLKGKNYKEELAEAEAVLFQNNLQLLSAIEYDDLPGRERSVVLKLDFVNQ